MNSANSYSGVAGEEASGLRLDRYVAEKLGLLSRSQIKARRLSAMVNGKNAKLSRLLANGDRLELTWVPAEAENLEPQDLPLPVIYEDDRVILINKPQGLVVHPGAGNRQGTVANALLYRRLKRGGAGGGFRPGIVHRLDKDTSGVLIAAYDDEALAFLAKQFRERKTKKTYIAIVKGAPPAQRGRIDAALSRDPHNRKRFAPSVLGGKSATTLYRVVRRWEGYSLLALRPKTGRTHQLRAHCRLIACPILGDPLYSKPDKRFPNATLMLHAAMLVITLPGELEPSVFKTPLPHRINRYIRLLNAGAVSDT